MTVLGGPFPTYRGRVDGSDGFCGFSGPVRGRPRVVSAGVKSYNDANDGFGMDCIAPSGVRLGDLLLLITSTRNNNLAAPINGAWFPLAAFRHGGSAGSSAQQRSAWRFASQADVDASAAGTALGGQIGYYSFNAALACLCIRNVDPYAPIIGVTNTYSDDAITASLAMDIPPWSGECLVLLGVGANSNNNSNVPTTTFPTGWSQSINGLTGGGRCEVNWSQRLTAVNVREKTVQIPSAALSTAFTSADSCITMAVRGPVLL